MQLDFFLSSFTYLLVLFMMNVVIYLLYLLVDYSLCILNHVPTQNDMRMGGGGGML